jgi:FMN phosphatase YigB (HAD superfamily)
MAADFEFRAACLWLTCYYVCDDSRQIRGRAMLYDKNVIFDLSEVLLPGLIGVEAQLSRETRLPSDKITRALGSFPHYEVGNNLDALLKGVLSYDQYRDNFLQTTGLQPHYRDIFDQACLRMFETPYDYTEAMLATAAERCDIFLLSDHCRTFVQWIEKRHPFISEFNDFVWSYDIGATKRERKPFEVIMSRNGLAAETCLFVDDLERNINMAKSFGMKTVHFTGRHCVQDVYRAIGAEC